MRYLPMFIPNTGGRPCTSPLGCSLDPSGLDPHAAPQPCTTKDSRRTRARATAHTLDSVRDHQPSTGTVLTTDAPPSSPALEGIASLDVLVHRCCHHGQNHCRSHTSATPCAYSLQRTTHALPASALHVLIGCSGIGLSVQQYQSALFSFASFPIPLSKPPLIINKIKK